MDELLVTVRAGSGRYPLVVEAQPIAETVEDASHGSETDLDAADGEFVGDLVGGTVRPADPVMGLPATSCCNIVSIVGITSGVLFPPCGAHHRGGARVRARPPRSAVAGGLGPRYRRR